jgi:hypothetical protein
MTDAELVELLKQGRDGWNRLSAELVELLKQGGMVGIDGEGSIRRYSLLSAMLT